MEDSKRQKVELDAANTTTPLLSRAAPIAPGYAHMLGGKEDDEYLRTPPAPLSMEGIASLLRREIQPVTSSMQTMARDFRQLESKFYEFREVVEERMQRLERHLDGTDVRVNKLKELYQQLHSTTHEKEEEKEKQKKTKTSVAQSKKRCPCNSKTSTNSMRL